MVGSSLKEWRLPQRASCCLLSMACCCSRTLPLGCLSDELWTSSPLSLSSFSSLKAGHLQVFRPVCCSPATGESARRPLKPPMRAKILMKTDGTGKIMGLIWGGRPLACGFLWNLTTVRDMFLFHYTDDILLTSVSFQFKSSSLVLWVDLTAWGGLVIQAKHKSLILLLFTKYKHTPDPPPKKIDRHRL